MSKAEDSINDFLSRNSREFLKRLKNCIAIRLKHNQGDNRVAARLMMIDEKVPIARRQLQSDSNGRKSKFDLYYESQNLAFIIELKVGRVGFRGVAQAAYYSACTSNRHNCVVLIAKDTGPDFDDFISKCMRADAWRNVIFVRYEDIGLNTARKPTWIAPGEYSPSVIGEKCGNLC